MKKIKIIFGTTLDFKKKYVLMYIGTVHNRLFKKMEKSGGGTVCIANLKIFSKTYS